MFYVCVSNGSGAGASVTSWLPHVRSEQCLTQNGMGMRPCLTQNGMGLRPCLTQNGMGMRPCLTQNGMGMRPCLTQNGMGMRPCLTVYGCGLKSNGGISGSERGSFTIQSNSMIHTVPNFMLIASVARQTQCGSLHVLGLVGSGLDNV